MSKTEEKRIGVSCYNELDRHKNELISVCMIVSSLYAHQLYKYRADWVEGYI